MSQHSPKVYLSTPSMEEVGTVKGADGLWRLAVTTDGSAGSPEADAFGRSRVSTPTSVFDAKQVFDNQPLLFAEHTASGGSTSYDNTRSSTKLLSGTSSGGRALRQTKRYLNYQPGKGQLIFATYNFHGAAANVSKRVGYFDDQDGVYVELNSVGGQPAYSIVKRSYVGGSLATTTVTQADWNIDPLDGTGPSGKSLNAAAACILVIDLEWLGVGQMRVGFDFGGALVYAHRFANSNIVTSVYMRTPNLPVRWEIVNTAAATGTPNMEAICCSVQSEGGANPLSVQRTVSRGATPVSSVTTTLQSVLAIRLQSAYNRATVFPLNGAAVTSDTGVNYYGQLVLNPTLGGALTYTAVTNSAAEASTTSQTVAGGTVLAEFYGIAGAPGKSGSASITTSSDLNSVLALASDYAGVSDQLVLAVRTLTGSSSNSFYAQLDWLELL